MFHDAVPFDTVDDDEAGSDCFAGCGHAGKRALVCAPEFAADDDFATCGKHIGDQDFVAGKGSFDVGDVLHKGFIGDILTDSGGRLRLTAESLQVTGDQELMVIHMEARIWCCGGASPNVWQR